MIKTAEEVLIEISALTIDIEDRRKKLIDGALSLGNWAVVCHKSAIEANQNRIKTLERSLKVRANKDNLK